MRPLRHFTVVAVLLLLARADAPAQVSSANTFRVFMRGVEIGIEEVTLLESTEGWTLRGSSKTRAPISVIVDYWEARYDRSWKPLELTVNATESGAQQTLRTTFSGTVASIEVGQGGQVQRATANVAPDAIILPNRVFGAYEALAARLAAGAQAGSRFQLFIALDAAPITVNNVTAETIQTPGRTITAQRWMLHIGGEGSKVNLDLEVWTENGRLLRIDIPSQMVSAVRDDIASVSARVVTRARPNDEQASIPANGFSLAATISKPAAAGVSGSPGESKAGARWPAVVLVSGSGPTDRDEVTSGIPIFAEIANVLADEGFLVVRYDERGIGQSGGRPETATLEEFATDARAVFAFLSKRKDVDPKRMSAIGYGEGGWVALAAAQRENRVSALTLIATPASSGAELVLEQQRHLLDRGATSESDQQSAVERQKAILAAVVTGKGWENITPDVRRRVDTPLYRSFLTFDPAQVIARVRQPLLVVQPALDGEVRAHHGEKLAQLGRSRPPERTTEFVQLSGVNHLLARATTGDVTEYDSLADRSVSAESIHGIASWLMKMLPSRPVK